MIRSSVSCRYHRRVSVIPLACVLAGVSAVASTGASAETQPPRMVVRYGDLNLSRAVDVEKAYIRLRRAATVVCPFADSSNYWLRVTAQPCVSAAIGRAVENINAPRLRSYYYLQLNESVLHARSPSSASDR